jgi:glycyl-tRNA synthetase
MPITPEKKMELLVSLCKRRGFIYPGSEIYGGFANSWDYGPYGAELKKNIRDAWWTRFVRGREDMVGVETPIVMHPKVWEASGHVATFTDPLVEDKKTHVRHRLDHLLEAAGVDVGGMSLDQMAAALKEKGLKSPQGNELADPKLFNLMLKTYLGVTEDAKSLAYLRPETAGGMFVAWKNVRDTARKRLPFGVAQIGKAFRNEITPGNFIFRTREFDQMEIEYFVKPTDGARAFDLWLSAMKDWVSEELRLSDANVVYHEIAEADRAFYSARTIDVEYRYPFGLKELYGLANRTDYDLTCHGKATGEDLRWLDPETNEKVLPHVIEPTWGLDRTVLVLLCEHLDVDEAESANKDVEPRMVLRLPPRLAPVKVAVLPLQKDEALVAKARELAASLRGEGWVVEYDESASIGKRYRRQDEVGTPWCVTVDFDSVNDGAVTVRNRDSMEQVRIPMGEVADMVRKGIKENRA